MKTEDELRMQIMNLSMELNNKDWLDRVKMIKEGNPGISNENICYELGFRGIVFDLLAEIMIKTGIRC